MTAPATAPTSSAKSSIITNLDATPVTRATSGGSANGVYGHGIIQRYQSTITPAASAATSVLHRFLRVPSNCVVQSLSVVLDSAASTLTGNFGLWWSDAADGTPLLQQGNLTAISSCFFSRQLVMAGFYNAQSGAAGHTTNPTDGTTIQMADGFVEITFANSAGAMTDGQYLPSQSGNPLWLAVANNLALQTTPVGAATSSSQAFGFNTASAGGSVYVWSQDPGGCFDICMQLSTPGSSANVAVTVRADVIHAMA